MPSVTVVSRGILKYVLNDDGIDNFENNIRFAIINIKILHII